MTSRRDFLAGTGATFALATLPQPAFAKGPDAPAEAILRAATEQLLRDGPEGATALGIDTGSRAGLRGALSDRSPRGQARIAANLRKTLAQIAKLETDRLSPTMQVNVDVVKTAFESALRGLSLGYGDVAVGGWRNAPYVVAQNVGAYLDTPRLLTSEQPVENATDASLYLERLEAYSAQLDGETERLRIAAGKGVIAPDFVIDKTLRQLRMSHDADPAGWGIVTTLANKTAGMKGDFGHQAFLLAFGRVRPALARQIAELERHRARSNHDAGVWRFPGGDEYYRWALSAGTTTARSPEEVHRQGRDELAALQAQMDTILRAQGFTQGSVGARMTAIGKDKRFLFPEGDAGRAEIMTFLRKHIEAVRARMPDAFHTLVPGKVEVKRLPPEEEPGAPGAYGGAGSVDGKIPGKFWINLRTTELHSRYSLPTLAHHESIPGHVWQGEYTFKLPLIRSILAFNAYSEGWALYAEQLADELGFYADDPIGKLGYLQSIAFRACRLVVDTGLHAKRWTREQAIQWFAETNGSGIEEVTSEVERYCSWPGQACGYKVGHSEINRLRAHAQAALGGRYDFRAFNDAVVLGGNVPMTVLGRVIDRHIAERQRG